MSKNLKNLEVLSSIIENAVNKIQSAAIPYLKELEGSTKQRIHNKGLDSDGQIIGAKSKRGGRYSPGYEKQKRKKSGVELYPINLQLNGDLSRAYTVGIFANKPVLQFHRGKLYPSSAKFDGKPASLAAIHSANYNTDIYRPSDEQLEDAKEVLIKGIEDVLRRSL